MSQASTQVDAHTPWADPLSAKDHKRVARYIQQTAGIQLPASKRSLIEGRLRKRQRKLGYASLHEYIEMVLESEAGAAERLHLLDAITTNKTDFYREPDHFRFLREYILGELAPLRAAGWERPLRIWSAGCSSGEEPYTIAMEMLEIRQDNPGFHFQVHATDISVSCLDTARRAIYPHARVEPVPLAVRRRYLLRSRDKTRDLVRMAPEVCEKVRFATFNLLTDSYDFEPRFDMIFCRNVMIYFNHSDRAQIAQRFAHSLQPRGVLFIGHSETLTGQTTFFQQLIPAVYQKIGDRR
ncbi:MAG: protein-glutamate O-methyltransferase CheR [Gammaproteobacteria bacterium]|nr:protein-glutamate O-methyltransferase CheR [Gammaproteobacteria bacterium]